MCLLHHGSTQQETILGADFLPNAGLGLCQDA
jgi:hypothetical protein